MLHLQLSDHDVEQLLAGDRPQDRPDYAEVALLMRRLRAEGAREQIPPMSPLLLAELDKAEAEAAEAQRSEQAETRRQVSEARRRWRVMAAAAAVVVLGGFAVAHAQGAFSAPEPTHTVDVSSGGSQVGADDDGTGDTGDDRVTAEAPEVTDPPVTTPPVTDPPVTEPPATEPADRGDGDGDGDRDRNDGDRDGGFDNGWDWDDDGEWDPNFTERGVEFDPDGEGGRDPIVFEYEWWEQCDQEPRCLWRKWYEANGNGGPDADGPGVYSQPGP